MTEGNVFLLGELVRAVEAEGWEPDAQNAARIGTLAPEAVLRAVAVRLMRLSDDAAGVARAVAVLGDDAHLRHVAALTGREPDRAAAAADALAASDILRPFDGGTLRFAHPLLASAVYADVGTGERAALHRRAAEILRDEGIAPERVAAHLLPSTGSAEAWVVEVLCEAAGPRADARRARVGGELPAARPRRAAGAGRARRRCCASSASARARPACRAPSSGSRRRSPPAATTAIARRRCSRSAARCATVGRNAEALAALDEVAATAGAEPRLIAQARAEAGALGALDPARRAALLAVLAPSPPRRPARARRARRSAPLLATHCLHETMRGAPRDDVVAIARRALAGETVLCDQGSGATVLFGISAALRSADELAWNDRVLTAALTQTRAQGSMMAFATASLCRAASRWPQGRLDEALADAEQALAAERYGWRQFLSAAYGVVVGLLIDRGELECRCHVRRAPRAARGPRGLGDARAMAPGARPPGTRRAPRARCAHAFRGVARRGGRHRQPGLLRRLALGLGLRRS